eukprot:8405944-Pyramimonas_sp.AAC.1
MAEVVAFAEKPPEEESQAVDLSTKSLQDLLGRETRRRNKSRRARVEEAAAALEEAQKWLASQRQQLASHT